MVSLKDKIKSFKWQDKFAAIIIILVLLIAGYQLLQLKHTPGPVFGGDLYRERGILQNMVNGNMPWTDPFIADEITPFPWFFHLLVYVCSIGGLLNFEKILTLFPLITTLFSLTIFYLLGIQLFKNRSFALILLFMASSTFSYVVPSPKWLGMWVLMPLFFLVWLNYEEAPSKKYAIFTGIVIGLAAMTHTTVFIGMFSIFSITIFIRFIIELIKSKNISIIVKYIKKYWIIFIFAFLIAIPFYLPVALKYQFNILNPTNEYALVSLEKQNFGWWISSVNIFFNFTRLSSIIFGLAAFIGLILTILNRKKQPGFVLLWFISVSFLGGLHFITQPLFGKILLTPAHIFSNIGTINFILITYGFTGIYSFMKKYLNKFMFISILLLIIFIPYFISNYNNYTRDQWTKYGKSMDISTNTLYEVGNWIKKSTDKNAVFLSNDESAFGLSVLSGRKNVFARRVHMSYFIDINQRYADGLVMLYGNDENTIKSLINKYNAEYLYIDQFLLKNPMISSFEHKEYLTKNGINFTIAKVPWDPSSPDAPRFESLIIPPQNLGKIETMIKTSKEFQINGQTYSKIFRINQ